MYRLSRQQNGIDFHSRELSGLDEVISIAKERVHSGKTQLGESSLSIEDGSWAGTRTLQEAIVLAEYGWPDGQRKLKKAMGQLAFDDLVGLKKAIEPYFSDAGDEVDVDRYLVGDPESMVAYYQRLDKQGKLATLLVNSSLSSGVSAQRILNRGVALLGVREMLQQAGYTLGITMLEVSTPSAGYGGTSPIVEYRVPIMKPGEYLDEDTIAFCLANPAYLRRFMFALNETEEDSLRRTMGYVGSGGYGRPTKIFGEVDPATFVIDNAEGLDLDTPEQIKAYAQTVVDRIKARMVGEE